MKPVVVLECAHLSRQGSSASLCVVLPSSVRIQSPKTKLDYLQRRLSLAGQSALPVGRQRRLDAICHVFCIQRPPACSAGTPHSPVPRLLRAVLMNPFCRPVLLCGCQETSSSICNFSLFKYGSIDLFLSSALLDKGCNYRTRKPNHQLSRWRLSDVKGTIGTFYRSKRFQKRMLSVGDLSSEFKCIIHSPVVRRLYKSQC